MKIYGFLICHPKNVRPDKFKVLETHLLGGSTLVHLSERDDDKGHHFHAKIPGLNYFEIGRDVYLSVSQNDVYLF